MTTAIFDDGFDIYGAPAIGRQQQIDRIGQWWTTIVQGSDGINSIGIVAGLSSTGYAVQFSGGGIPSIIKNLTANFTRCVGTMRFNYSLGNNGVGINLRDNTTNQCSLVLEPSTGTINLRSANANGTILSGASGLLTANSTHTLSWDITIGASAAYQVWLDGTSIFSGTGNTRGGTSNNYFNAINLGGLTGIGGTNNFIVDDFAIIDGSVSFDSTITTTNPRIETQIGSGSNQTQFTIGTTQLGESYYITGSTSAPGANQLFLRQYIPEVNETINSVSCLPGATSATAKFKAAIYPSSGGSPNAQTLMSGGPEVIGCTSGATLTCGLTTPQALTAGTPYWIGLITDTSVALNLNDSATAGVRAAATYTSGVPGTCPTVTTGQSDWCMWGNCTGAAVNWPAVKHVPFPGDISYVYSNTVGNEDLLSFPALTTTPTKIYFGAVRAHVKRSDAGARTIDLRMKSSSTSSSGSQTGQSPALSYTMLNSYFATDPNTGSDWTPSGWNGSFAGYKIAA